LSTQQTAWARRFFTIWTGQAFSLFGSSLVQFALVWWLTVSTGSATVLATATLFAVLPEIFMGPFAGALVDRWNRRVVMIVADGAIALATIGLVILFASGRIQVWHIYAIMLIRSAAGAFHWPAMQASTSLLVPEKELTRIAGLNQTLHGVMRIVAPPVGAILVTALSMHMVLLIDVVTAVIAILPLLVFTIPQPQRQMTNSTDGKTVQQSYVSDLRDGLRYVAAWKGLLIIGLMATVLNFLATPAFSLLPLLVTKHFGGQALELGWISSVEGLGFLCGGILLSVWGGFRRKIMTSMVGLIGSGVGILLIGFAPANLFVMALGAVFIAGVMNPLTNGPLIATLQASVAPEMQGRVLSLIGSVASAMSPLSLAVAGPLADAFGIQIWYIVAGVVFVLMGVAAFFIPALMHVEDRTAT
jgi:DHA3 family macrolide efflux protein-like MFS transporter